MVDSDAIIKAIVLNQGMGGTPIWLPKDATKPHSYQ